MCRSCWVEAGSPTEKTSTTDHLVRLIRALYCEHVTGGPLHVNLDDNNLDGGIEPFYRIFTESELAKPLDFLDDDLEEFEGRSLRSICDEIAELLNEMTEPQRYAAIAYWNGYIPAGETA